VLKNKSNTYFSKQFFNGIKASVLLAQNKHCVVREKINRFVFCADFR